MSRFRIKERWDRVNITLLLFFSVTVPLIEFTELVSIISCLYHCYGTNNQNQQGQLWLHCSWQQIKVQPWFQIQCFAGSDRHILFCHSLLPHSLVPQLAHVFSRSTTAQCNSPTVLSFRSCTNWTYKLDSL